MRTASVGILSPVLTMKTSPTKRSNTETLTVFPERITGTVLSQLIVMSFQNCFSFTQSFPAVTVTMIVTAMQIVTPSIHPFAIPSFQIPIARDTAAAKIKIYKIRSSNCSTTKLHKLFVGTTLLAFVPYISSLSLISLVSTLIPYSGFVQSHENKPSLHLKLSLSIFIEIEGFPSFRARLSISNMVIRSLFLAVSPPHFSSGSMNFSLSSSYVEPSIIINRKQIADAIKGLIP